MQKKLIAWLRNVSPLMWGLVALCLVILLAFTFIYTWWPVSRGRQQSGVVMVTETRHWVLPLPDDKALYMGLQTGADSLQLLAFDSTQVLSRHRATGFFTHPTGIVQTQFADPRTLAIPTDTASVRSFLREQREEAEKRCKLLANRAEELKYFLDTHASGDEGYDLILPLQEQLEEESHEADSLVSLIELALDSDFDSLELHRNFTVSMRLPGEDKVRDYPARMLRADGQLQLLSRHIPDGAYFFNTSLFRWWSGRRWQVGYTDFYIGQESTVDTLAENLIMEGPQWVNRDSCGDVRFAPIALGSPIVDGLGHVRGVWNGHSVTPLGGWHFAPRLWWHSLCQWFSCKLGDDVGCNHTVSYRSWTEGDSLVFEGTKRDVLRICRTDSSTYFGHLKGKKFDGMGCFCDSTGARWWGRWQGDSLPSGHFQHGDTLYEGEFNRQGQFEGQGVLTTSRVYYAGGFAKGERDGFGFDFSPGKILRSGTWAHDRFRGEQLLYTRDRVYGIDISRYQHEQKRRRYGITWRSLRITRLNRRGNLRVQGPVDFPVTFCYIKATQGVKIRSKYYASDAASARRQGIHVGAYHFFAPTDGARQARMFLSVARPHRGDLPPVLDVELTRAQINRMGGVNAMLRQILVWMRRVRSATGTRPVLYVSQTFINRYLSGAPAELQQYPVWIARYSEFKPYVHLKYWQISPEGSVRGIHGEVDIDVFNGTRQQFNDYVRENGVK